MKQEVSLVFPFQLFKENPAIHKDYTIILVEEWHFFNQYNFHQQKLVLHRASMKYYEEFLTKKGLDVVYIDAQNTLHKIEALIHELKKKKVKTVRYVELTDNWLTRKLQNSCRKNKIETVVYDSPNFLNNLEAIDEYKPQAKSYFQTDFYIHERKKRKVLLEDDGPVGGKWTYDADNRERLPKNIILPTSPLVKKNKFVTEAESYVQQHYNNNYGKLNIYIKEQDSKAFYATTHQEADNWLDSFLAHRFLKFGIYEDAIDAKEHFLFHSVLTPMLNVGLLTPQQIIDKTLRYTKQNDIPLNSVEGFIRQIMGWREFIRLVYLRAGSKQRTTNYWNFTRKIPKSFWEGKTDILPIDVTIEKTIDTAYNHHIERLMILGNFFLLCEFDPNEVHRWFMEMYIDAYDWVMVPNVYGMTQFADGGLMTTKPYISGSNYLMKMGNYPKGKWQEIWDALFWRFMAVHQNFFSKNPRLGMLLNTWHKMPAEKKEKLLNTAENYLQSLDKQLI